MSGNPNDLLISMEINLHEAICGNNIDFIHFDGKVRTISIPENCYNGLVVYDDLGMPIQGRDNMYGKLHVKTSIKNTSRSKEKRNLIWKLFTGSELPLENKKAVIGQMCENTLDDSDDEGHQNSQGFHGSRGHQGAQCAQQ